MATVSIGTPCGGPYGLGLWASATEQERRQIANSNWAIGMVAFGDVDFASSVAPQYYYPPGHACNSGNKQPDAIGAGSLFLNSQYAEDAAAGQVAGIDPSGDSVTGSPNGSSSKLWLWVLAGLVGVGAIAIARKHK